MRKFVPAWPEALARACPPSLVAVLMAGVLSACGGGGGGGGTQPPTTTLSADQKIYEDAAFRNGGIGSISYAMPYGGGQLESTSDYVFSVTTMLSRSPSTAGSQVVTPQVASVTPWLSGRTPSKSWYLVGGQFVARSATANEQVSYPGTAVRIVRYADDNHTIVDGFDESAFREVALTGPVSSAPAELLALLPLDLWAAGGNFTASMPWMPGAAYVARKETLTGDRTLLEACYASPDLATASTAAMPPPCFSGSLASRFPLTLYYPANSHPRATYAAADGTISTVQGLQVWTANQPEASGSYPTRSYRVFIQQGPSIYAGVMQRQGTAATSTLGDGSVVAEAISLDLPAITTVGQGIQPSSVMPSPQTAGILRNVATLDLYGIGGTGVNGALSATDLRTHYRAPPSLDGTGQTIAVVDSPGPSSINYVDDLQAYSRAFGLPVCADAAGSCFQHVDLSNGSFSGTGNGGAGEATLDIEMVHAIAPGANIVLVTAASGSLADMMAALNYAASLPQVTAVSASWSYDDASNAGTIANEEFQLAQFVAQGKVFFASSGDAGQFPGSGPSYPAISPYFTAVGGTRINAVAPTAGGSSDTGWIFSGGGDTPWMAMPAWQQAFIGSSQVVVNMNQRAVPDVTAVADPVHSPVAMYFRQRWTMEGGTSVGAPLWAGIAALVAQQQAAAGTTLAARVAATPGGFNGLLYRASLFAGADPALQALAGGTSFSQASSCGSCSVVPGYNDVGGLGTPDVASLIAAF